MSNIDDVIRLYEDSGGVTKKFIQSLIELLGEYHRVTLSYPEDYICTLGELLTDVDYDEYGWMELEVGGKTISISTSRLVPSYSLQ